MADTGSRGFVQARFLERCLSSGQTLPESRAAVRFLKADERSTLPLPEWPQPHPSPEVAADDARPRAAVTSRRHANCPLLSPFPANSGANPRLLSHRNSGVARARPSAGLHEVRSRLSCHEVPMLASPSSTPRALFVERMGRAAMAVAFLALGGCSASSSADHGQAPRTFSTLADCFFRSTADHREETISVDEAHRLAANPFGISLRRLRTLDAAAARELAACRGFLHFAVLPMLTAEAAAELATHTDDLRLDRLETLSADSARALARHAGALHLNGLRSIDVATAEALATHEGLLALNGLEDPEEEVILAIARHRGHLCLNGVETLSREAAGALAARRGKASLHGLASLTYQSLVSLLHHSDRSGVDLPDWIPTGRSGEIGLWPASWKGEGKPLPRPVSTPSALASIND